MPSRGEDIGKKNEVSFVLLARWELEGVEIGVGDANILCLA